MTNTKTKAERQKRKHLSASQKMTIVRRHLGPKRETVAGLAAEFAVPPGSIYQWVQRLLDNGDVAIEGKPRGENIAAKQSEQKIVALTARLAKKDQVIAELFTEMLELKKYLGPSKPPQGSPGFA
jgi:transposase-like protein